MPKHHLALALFLSCALFGTNAAFARNPSKPDSPVTLIHKPTPPSQTIPYIVPYSCGSGVSSYFTHNSLSVTSDSQGDAGFAMYSSQSATLVPFPPGIVSFAILNAKPGDTLSIIETDVNGVTGGTTTQRPIHNNVNTIDLSEFTSANIKELECKFYQSHGSSILLNTFHFNDHGVPFDLSHSVGCSGTN